MACQSQGNVAGSGRFAPAGILAAGCATTESLAGKAIGMLDGDCDWR